VRQGEHRSRFLSAAVVGEAEGEDALMIRGALKDFGMAQSTNGIAIAGPPVLLHAGAREVPRTRRPDRHLVHHHLGGRARCTRTADAPLYPEPNHQL
jgi:hypothetical protein